MVAICRETGSRTVQHMYDTREVKASQPSGGTRQKRACEPSLRFFRNERSEESGVRSDLRKLASRGIRGRGVALVVQERAFDYLQNRNPDSEREEGGNRRGEALYPPIPLPGFGAQSDPLPF